jgi:hypothetical protein
VRRCSWSARSGYAQGFSSPSEVTPRRVPDLLCDPCSPVILGPGAGVGSMATGATYDPR